MSRGLAPLPRIALTLREAAEAADVPSNILLAAIYYGELRAKRTSVPYRFQTSRYGVSWTGGRYLIAPEDLMRWLLEHPPIRS